MADEFSGREREKNSGVMESFWTIKGAHLGQTHFQNVVSRGSGFCGVASETVAVGGGEEQCWDHQVITLNVYMKLCVSGAAPRAPLLQEKDALFL